MAYIPLSALSTELVTTTGSPSARSLGSRFVSPFNVMDFGAVSNGSSNPASTKYGTLAALQAVYGTTISGVTVALTQELDWLAAQLAINTAKTSTYGGTVYFPAGNGAGYIMSNSNSVSDGSGTLAMPEVNVFFTNTTPIVHLVGDGEMATVLYWPVDLGVGKFGILDTNRQTTTQGNAGTVKDLTLRGPAIPYALGSIGASKSNMSGYGAGSYKNFVDFAANAFHAGIDFVGGQNQFTRVILENDYYGLYYSNPNASLFGDTLFERCIFGNCLLAGIGVHHAANINQSVFVKCTLAASPWGIFKETNSGSPTSAFIMSGCTLTGTQFEQMGNGGIGDDQLISANTANSTVTSLFLTHFKDTFYSWSATYKASAYGAFVCFAANDVTDCEWDGITNWSPGSAGVVAFHNGGASGVVIRGDITALITAINAATSKNLNAAQDEFCTIRVINTSGFYWEGYTACCSSTPTANQVINVTAGQFSGVLGLGAACGGTTSDAPAGVCMFINATTGTFGFGVIVADRGFVTVKSSGTYTTTASQVTWLRTGSAGAMIVASSSNDNATSPIIGILAGIPGSTTPTTVVMKVKGIS